MSQLVSFEVNGIPKPQGSMRAVVRGGRAVVLHDSGRELSAWRGWIYAAAMRAARVAGVRLPIDGPLAIRYEFRLPKPRTARRDLPCVKPDLDKLVRAVNDALGEPGPFGKVIAEDSRIVEISASKTYADGSGDGAPGVAVKIWRMS